MRNFPFRYATYHKAMQESVTVGMLVRGKTTEVEGESNNMMVVLYNTVHCNETSVHNSRAKACP